MSSSSGISTMLTIGSAVSAIAAVIFTARGTKRACDKLAQSGHLEDALTKDNLLRTVSEVYQEFIPAAAALTASIGCGVGSHCVSVRAQMATAGAVAALGTQLKNLDRGARELLGKEKYDQLKSSITAKSINPKDVITQKIKEPDKDCYFEPYTRQMFSAEEKDILKIECELNRLFQRKSYVTFAEYLSFFPEDMNITPADHEYGWYMDENFDWNSGESGDGYYISVNCSGVDVEGGFQAIGVYPSIPPSDPSDDWVMEDQYWDSTLTLAEWNGKNVEVAA